MNSELKLNSVPAAKKRKRGASLDNRKARAGWMFVMPFVLSFIIIYLPIIIDSIKYSFNKIKIGQGGGYTLEFVGWENYQEALFVDPQFVQTLTSGIQQLIFDIPAIVIFSLFMAVLLNQKMVGRAAFRAIFFIPVIISTGIIDKIDQANTMLEHMENVEEGINDGSGQNTTNEILSAVDIERLFDNMKVGTELVDYVVTMVNNVYNIINRSGVQMLIYLAGLQSISPSIYESCDIDGATAWETFWKITFPMLAPQMAVNVVYTLVATGQGGSVLAYANSMGTSQGNYGLGTAMIVLYLISLAVVLSLLFAVLARFMRNQNG